MKKTRYAEEQLNPAETGTRVEEVGRKMGMSKATFTTRRKIEGMGVTELRRHSEHSLRDK